MEYGLTVGQVFNEIYARIAAPTTATTLTTEIREYDVYVINEADSQMTRQELAGIRIKYTDKEGNQQFVTLSEIAQKLLVGGNVDPAAARDEMLHTMACKAAIKGGQRNGKAELEEVAHMVMSGAVKYCPHGRPVAIEMTKYQLEKQFKRA